MTKQLLAIAVIVVAGILQAQNSSVIFNNDPHEVRFIKDGRIVPDKNKQNAYSQSKTWQNFKANHGLWNAHFNEITALPHRAYGQPIQMNGSSVEIVAQNFINQELAAFGLAPESLEYMTTTFNGKHSWVFYTQSHEGIPILFSKVVVKVSNQYEVIMFGIDTHDNINIDVTPQISDEEALAFARADFSETTFEQVEQELSILPIPINGAFEYHLVYTAAVHSIEEFNIPTQYFTLIDAMTGEILYRQNMVHSCGPDCTNDHNEESVAVNTKVSGTGHLVNASIAPIELNMPNVEVNINGSVYNADTEGNLLTGEIGPVAATITLQGLYSQVINNQTNSTPSLVTTLLEGDNLVTFDFDANINEISAYHSVNVIHDHMKSFLPDFMELDNPLETNVDIDDQTCNAYANGESINFFVDLDAGDCVALSKISDVVYHEYGHIINGRFYNELGANFQNGGMNEGYADVWAFGPNEDPVLADGFNPQDWDDWFRRYDQDPKVYPQDLTGQVHANGEIIAGAWWDLYENLNFDMNATMELFALAYPGLQAIVPNGEEGVAFHDVLLDVLQADDDDNDLSNGTPNLIAIVEAFEEHGIVLPTTFELFHDEVLFNQAGEGINIEAELSVEFDFIGFEGDIELYYRSNEQNDWTGVEMENTVGDLYEYEIPAQLDGTIVYYYLVLLDSSSGDEKLVSPLAANKPNNANIPFTVLVGYEQLASYDSDNNLDWGDWTTGLPTDDASSGQWEENEPVGSVGGTVAPGEQNTPGGALCFLTGQATNPNVSYGANDVDGGTTTLVSPIINLSSYDNPTFTYYRWYTNSPEGAANPGTDWWQGYVSEDGGTNWVELDVTSQSDASWRRFAFRVQDYVNITSDFMMKFHVSDSTDTNQPGNGGSIVEGALDDFVLWDNISVGIDDNILDVALNIYPNPADDLLNILIHMETSEKLDLEILNNLGQIIARKNLGIIQGQKQFELNIADYAVGNYKVRLLSGNQFYTKAFTKL